MNTPTTSISPRAKQMHDITRVVSERWGVKMSPNCVDPLKEIRVALKESISQATNREFKYIYPDDHSWSSIGLKGLNVQSLEEDEAQGSLSPSSDEWGIAAIVKGFDNVVMIPIARYLDEPMSKSIVEIIDNDPDSYLNLDDIGEVISHQFEGDPDSEKINITFMTSNWSNIIDLSKESILPLSKSIYFRRPVAWDLLRASLTDATCPSIKEFTQDGFNKRYFRSVRFDRNLAQSNIEILNLLAIKIPDLSTQPGAEWFNTVCDALNSLGDPTPFEGLSVILHLQTFDRDDDLPDTIPIDTMLWKTSSVMNICIGYGLDPLRASFIETLVRDEPDLFHDFTSSPKRRYQSLAVSVIPDIHLAGIGATTYGRNSYSYERLVAATSNIKESEVA